MLGSSAIAERKEEKKIRRYKEEGGVRKTECRMKKKKKTRRQCWKRLLFLRKRKTHVTGQGGGTFQRKVRDKKKPFWFARLGGGLLGGGKKMGVGKEGKPQKEKRKGPLTTEGDNQPTERVPWENRGGRGDLKRLGINDFKGGSDSGPSCSRGETDWGVRKKKSIKGEY